MEGGVRRSRTGPLLFVSEQRKHQRRSACTAARGVAAVDQREHFRSVMSIGITLFIDPGCDATNRPSPRPDDTAPCPRYRSPTSTKTCRIMPATTSTAMIAEGGDVGDRAPVELDRPTVVADRDAPRCGRSTAWPGLMYQTVPKNHDPAKAATNTCDESHGFSSLKPATFCRSMRKDRARVRLAFFRRPVRARPPIRRPLTGCTDNRVLLTKHHVLRAAARPCTYRASPGWPAGAPP